MLSILKIVGPIFILLFISQAEAQSASPEHLYPGNYTLEVRVNPFFPTGKRLRKIYSHVWPNYGIEASGKINTTITGWANIDFTNCHGHVHECHTSSKIRILNGSFGLKLTTHKTSNLQIYMGLGPVLGGVWIHNDSFCNNHHIRKFALGGIIKIGLMIYLPSRWTLNFFGDYSYEPVWFKRTVNIGGAKAGLGLGNHF